MISISSREKWYSFVPALFGARDYLSRRELMFLKGIRVRWCQAQSVTYLQKVLKTFDVHKKSCTAYASLDHYAFIPQFTADLSKRKEETDKWATEQKTIVGVDFGIDLDFKDGDWRDSLEEAYHLAEFLEKSGLKYAVWSSLGHGFHFVIPWEEIKIANPNITVEQARDLYREIAVLLKETIAPHLDTTAYMETRVFKAPYMLNHEDEVVLPLYFSDLKLLFHLQREKKLEKDYFTVDKVMRNFHIVKRGTFLNGTSGNFEAFVEEVDALVELFRKLRGQ